MRTAVLVGPWILLIAILFFVGTMLYEWPALDRERDGWCELRPDGLPSADDPDCEGWEAGEERPAPTRP